MQFNSSNYVDNVSLVHHMDVFSLNNLNTTMRAGTT